MTRTGLFLLLSVLAAGSAAQGAAPDGKTLYDHCLARAAGHPDDALREATDWQKTGGGAAADHCMAVALVGLHRYAAAGDKLDALARGGFASDPSIRIELFDQAGNAWLLAGKPDTAIASFSAALALDPANADILSDRARAHALKKNWARAESDLTAALLVNANRADLLVLRGSARHALGHKPEARADFERALKLHPGLVDALVERGTMKYEAGDTPGARLDWSQVVATAPNSAAAASARQHLADTEPATVTPAPPAAISPAAVPTPPRPH